MRRKINVSFLLVICIFLLTACGSLKIDPVIVNPKEIFTGKMKLLEPHLDFRVNAMNVTYKGEKSEAKLLLEVWQDGKLISEQECIGWAGVEEDSIKNSLLTVSSREEGEGKYKFKILFDGCFAEPVLDIPRGYYFNIVMVDSKKTYLDSEDIVLWGMMGSKIGEGVTFYNNVKDTLEKTELAVMLKIKFE